jgi:DNA-binding MarR family transcriptional regulator
MLPDRERDSRRDFLAMALDAILERMERVGLDAYVIDVLLRDLVGHDRTPSAFLVWLWLWRRTEAGETRLPLRRIAEGTGLSKRGVQAALDHLERRRLVRAERESVTAVAEYTVLRPWAR